MPEFIDALPTVREVFLSLGSAIVGFLILVLKNRRPLLTYSVSHQQIGVTANDDVYGEVEVRSRGTTVQNLYFSTIEIRNRSMKDLADVDIKTCRGFSEMAILTEQTGIQGTVEPLNLTQEYLDRVKADLDWENEVRTEGTTETPENARRLQRGLSFRFGLRHYVIPVFNRGQVATISYLVTTSSGAVPSIHITCQTKGVRLKERPYPRAVTQLLGVPMPNAALTGVLVGVGLVGLMVWQMKPLWIVAC